MSTSLSSTMCVGLDDCPSRAKISWCSRGLTVFLTAGYREEQAISNSTEILTSPKMLALVEEVNHRVPLRVVMSDRPSLLRMADVFAFSRDTDALLQVVEQGKTTAEDVQRASSLVNDSRPVLRIVLNRAGPLAATSASMKQLRSLSRGEH